MMDMRMKKTSGAITNCRINGDNMVMVLCVCVCDAIIYIILHYINIFICDIFMQTLVTPIYNP